MAFPTIPTVAASRILFTLNTAGGATKTFPDLSSLTKNAGDLLLAIIVEYDGNSTNAEFSSWGGSFTEIADRAGTATMAIGVAWKISTGSETGTFTVTTADATTNDSVMILLSIPGAHDTTAPEVSVMTTSAAAPPAVGTPLNPANWDVEDTLWVAVGGSGETSLTGSYTGIASGPASYTDYAESGITADAIGGVEAALAFRQLAAASEAPGAWTGDTSNARGAALVIAVRPAALVDADAEVAWAELEIPDVPILDADAEVAWAELEVPTADSRADIAWAELEVPTADSSAQVAWTELEVPNLGPADANAEIAWAEFEVPTADAAAHIAWAELEVPTEPLADANAEVTWAELEVPTASAAAHIAWAELEVPTAESAAYISWAELEVPTASASGEIAFASFEAPLADADAEISWVEFQIPSVGEVIASGRGRRPRTRAYLSGRR